MLDPYFSGTKIEWLLRNSEAARDRAAVRDDRLVAGLQAHRPPRHGPLERLAHLLFDIHERRWDPDLCALLGVDPERLPEVLPSAQVYGTTTEFGGEVPVAGIAGDQQAALFGQACHSAGQGKNT